MKTAKTVAFRLLLAGFLCFTLSCGSPTQPSAKESICFTVSGFNVSIANMWRSGAVHRSDVQGLTAFTETTSSGSETHTLEWTNIQNNYTTFTVTSFSVRIDGRSYSYPANKCS